MACGLALIAISISPATRAHELDRYSVFLPAGVVREVPLPAGQSVTVQTPSEIGDIVVGNPNIADVSPLTEASMYLLGKQIGRTTVTIYDLQKRPIGVLLVEVGADVNDLRKTLQQHLPGADIRISDWGLSFLDASSPPR